MKKPDKEIEKKFSEISRTLFYRNSYSSSSQSFFILDELSDFRDKYEFIESCYEYPLLKLSVVMTEWVMIKNLIQFGHINSSGSGLNIVPFIAKHTNLFKNYSSRIDDLKFFTEESISFFRNSGNNYDHYIKDVDIHPLVYVSKYINLTQTQMENIFLIRTYAPEALYGQELILDKHIGNSFLMRPSRGGLINKIRKSLTSKKALENYAGQNMYPKYDIDAHIERLKKDMSWINLSPIESRRAFLKGNWSLSDLQSEGVDINNLADSLNEESICFNRKQIMTLQMEILSSLIPGLTGKSLEKTEKVMNRIIELCPHDIIDDKILSEQLERTLNSKLATSSQKLAATIGAKAIGRADIEFDFSDLSFSERRKTLKNILGSKYKDDPILVIELMRYLGINTETKRVSKMKKNALMDDLGI